MDSNTVAYLAGLFDGEGCVEVKTYKSGNMHFHLTITNTNREALELCEYLFGGSIRARKRQPHVFDWQIAGNDAATFATAIEPFSIIKRDQLKLFIEGRKLLGARGQTVTEEEKLRRWEVSDMIKSLKETVRV